MIETGINEISDIWKDLYIITQRDRTFLRKPVRGKFDGTNYGVYCGPLTDPSFAEGYENGDPYGDPIDGLDFLCYLHDKFFNNPISDDLFVRSIDILNTHRMVGQKININGTRNLLTIIRKTFNVWRVLWSR